MLKNPWVVVGLITVALVGGAILFAEPVTEEYSEENNAGVEVLAHKKGNIESEIKLVEYSDLQCPACASFQPVLEEIMSQYGEEISFEYKHFPLPMHPYAMSAAIAVEAAGQQGKFFEFHDLLFANQQAWSSSLVTAKTSYVEYATELGLDVEQFQRQLKSSMLRDKILAEQKEGRELKITGTPTFFLNGKKMEFDTFADFVGQIAYAVDPTAVSEAAGAVTETAPAVKFGF